MKATTMPPRRLRRPRCFSRGNARPCPSPTCMRSSLWPICSNSTNNSCSNYTSNSKCTSSNSSSSNNSSSSSSNSHSITSIKRAAAPQHLSDTEAAHGVAMHRRRAAWPDPCTRSPRSTVSASVRSHGNNFFYIQHGTTASSMNNIAGVMSAASATSITQGSPPNAPQLWDNLFSVVGGQDAGEEVEPEEGTHTMMTIEPLRPHSPPQQQEPRHKVFPLRRLFNRVQNAFGDSRQPEQKQRQPMSSPPSAHPSSLQQQQQLPQVQLQGATRPMRTFSLPTHLLRPPPSYASIVQVQQQQRQQSSPQQLHLQPFQLVPHWPLSLSQPSSSTASPLVPLQLVQDPLDGLPYKPHVLSDGTVITAVSISDSASADFGLPSSNYSLPDVDFAAINMPSSATGSSLEFADWIGDE